MKIRLLLTCALIILILCSSADAVFVTGSGSGHTTTFGLTEDPISEGSQWVNGEADGDDWHDILTGSGYAYGDPAPEFTSDPTANLKGSWAANQGVKGHIYIPDPNERCYQECEIRLRQTISAGSMVGYEVCYRAIDNSTAYLSLARWNGALERLTILKAYYGSTYGTATGDELRAEIIGNTIYAYINDDLVGQVTDDDIVTGAPGIGYDFGCDASDSDYGFTDIRAYSINHDTVTQGTVCDYATNEIGDRTNRTTGQSTTAGMTWAQLFTPDCNGYLDYGWVKTKDAGETLWMGVFLDDGDGVPDSGDTLVPTGATGLPITWRWLSVTGTAAAFTRSTGWVNGYAVSTGSNYWVVTITRTANTLYYGSSSGKTVYYQDITGAETTPPSSLPDSGWSSVSNISYSAYVEIH